MEKPVENLRKPGRRRTAPPSALQDLAEAAARKISNGRYGSYQTKWEAAHQVKYQCNLALDEAAVVEAAIRRICPTATRYGVVRALLLALGEEGENQPGGKKGPGRSRGGDQ